MGSLIDFEETELRLGLPGGDGGRGDGDAVKKRGFTETVDLKLNLLSKPDEGHKTTHKIAVSSSVAKDLPKPPPAKYNPSLSIFPYDNFYFEKNNFKILVNVQN